MASDEIRVIPLTSVLGARVEGVQVVGLRDRDVIRSLRSALLEHLVLVLPGHALTPQEQWDFASAFGVPLTLTDVDPADGMATVSYTATGGVGADTFSFTVSDGMATTASEVATVTVNFPANSAITLDGTDDYVDIAAVGLSPALDIAGDLTLEAWFRTPISITAQTDFAAIAQRVRTSGVNDDSYGIVVGDGEYLRFLIGNDTAEESVDTLGFTAAVDTWYHVAGVFDVSVPELRIYINGVFNNSAPVSIAPTAADGPLQFGHTSYPGTPVYFAGDIDDVRVWSVARTQEQITNAASKTLLGSEVGLAGYWNFDDATAADITGASAPGTLENGASTTPSLLTLDTNTPPSADTGITVSVDAGQTVLIPLTGTDPDFGVDDPPNSVPAALDALEFSLDSNFTNDLVVFLSLTDADPADASATVSYTAPIVAGTDTFGFTVSDGLEESASALVTINITQPANMAGVFDGVDDVMTLTPSAPNLPVQAMTVEGWARFDSHAPLQAIVSAVEDTASVEYGFVLGTRTSGDDFLFGLSTVGGAGAASDPDGLLTYIFADAAPFALGAWNHLAGTYDGTTMSLYVNGALVASSTAQSGNIDYTGVAAMGIGAYTDSNELHPVDGAVDEVRLWNVARTQQGIQNGMSKSLAGWESGLLGYWNFDDGSPTDLAGGNDGTFAGGAAVGSSAEVYLFNTTPVATPGVTATVTLGDSVSFTVQGTDSDGDALAFEIDEIANASFDSDYLGATTTLTDADPNDNMATITYTPNGQVGADTVSFKVSDGMDTSSRETVDITVTLPANPAAAFPGGSDVVSLGPSLSNLPVQAMTVEGWARYDSYAAWQAILSAVQDNAGAEYGFVLGTGSSGSDFVFGLSTVGGAATASDPDGLLTYLTAGASPFARETWHHLAGTYDGTTMSLYVNGVLAASSIAQSGDIDYTGLTSLSLGAFTDFNEFHSTDGAVDEVRLWAVARTQAEIQNAMDKVLTGSEAGLLGYWNFDDGTPNDLAAGGNDGTFVGGAGIGGNTQTFLANSVPTATAATASAGLGQTVVVPIAGSDPDGDALSFALLSPTSTFGAPLTLIDNLDGTATVDYVASGGNGVDTFDYVVSDGLGDSAPAAVTVTVTLAANLAAAFDGNGDAIDLPDDDAYDFAPGQDFTVSLWINPVLGQANLLDTDNSFLSKWDENLEPGSGFPYALRWQNSQTANFGLINASRY
ncbi:MAG: LamG-like jellyroll fold domain-containing protein, partial [Candidatus Poribacteria bacterium]